MGISSLLSILSEKHMTTLNTENGFPHFQEEFEFRFNTLLSNIKMVCLKTRLFKWLTNISLQNFYGHIITLNIVSLRILNTKSRNIEMTISKETSISCLYIKGL